MGIKINLFEYQTNKFYKVVTNKLNRDLQILVSFYHLLKGHYILVKFDFFKCSFIFSHLVVLFLLYF